MYNTNLQRYLEKIHLFLTLFGNKNTRTLGAGDNPALKFFFVFNYQTHVILLE